MTPADFRLAFPAFKDAMVWTDDVITARLASSAPYFDVCRWGAFLDQGQGNWVAHDLVTNPPDGSAAAAAAIAGDAISKTVGTVSVARSSELLKAQMENPYMTTRYGQRYQYLARQRGVGAVVVNPSCGFGGLVGALGGPFS